MVDVFVKTLDSSHCLVTRHAACIPSQKFCVTSGRFLRNLKVLGPESHKQDGLRHGLKDPFLCKSMRSPVNYGL